MLRPNDRTIPHMPPEASCPIDPAAPAPAVWEFAGLMLTYRCSARCAFCYVHGGPDADGGEMSVAGALALWRGLDELAATHGRTMRIHLAGGEPCLDWPRLRAILAGARAAGLSPPEKLETNASWAVDDATTRARLAELAALGVGRLMVSSDVYHQEHVPFERVQRCVTLAREILGPGRVIVRWWDFFQHPQELRDAPAAVQAAAYRATQARHPDRLTGRAARELAPLLPRQPVAAFRGRCCVEAILGSRHIHIDPAGHVFPGLCAGIVLGRVTLPPDQPAGGVAGGLERPPGRAAEGPSPAAPDRVADVAAVWTQFAAGWRAHPVVAAVVSGGSYALYEKACEYGYVALPEAYADKCHLCTEVRTYLLERGLWREHVGPPAAYGRSVGEGRKGGEAGDSGGGLRRGCRRSDGTVGPRPGGGLGQQAPASQPGLGRRVARAP